MTPVTNATGHTTPRQRQRSSSVRQVRDLLRSAILAGELGDGALPSEQELIAEYDSSRGVIREVLDLLRREGLIERVQGAGTFVTSPALSSYGIDLLDGHLTGIHPSRMHRQILHREERRAPGYIARRLEVPAGSSVIYQERLNSLDGSPLALRTGWTSAQLGAHLQASLASDVPSLRAIDSISGYSLRVAELKVEACLADPTTAPSLGIDVGRPLLLVERLVRGTDGEVLELSYSRIRGDRILLSTELRRSEEAAAG